MAARPSSGAGGQRAAAGGRWRQPAAGTRQAASPTDPSRLAPAGCGGTADAGGRLRGAADGPVWSAFWRRRAATAHQRSRAPYPAYILPHITPGPHSCYARMKPLQAQAPPACLSPHSAALATAPLAQRLQLALPWGHDLVSQHAPARTPPSPAAAAAAASGDGPGWEVGDAGPLVACTQSQQLLELAAQLAHSRPAAPSNSTAQSF